MLQLLITVCRLMQLVQNGFSELFFYWKQLPASAVNIFKVLRVTMMAGQLNNELKLVIKLHKAVGSCRFRWQFSVGSSLSHHYEPFHTVIWYMVIIYKNIDYSYIGGITRVITTDPVVCTKCQGNPSKSYWHISLKKRKCGPRGGTRRKATD